MSPQQRACQLPSLPVPNYSLGPQILSAQSSSNNQHHYHHHNIIQPQSSNPISRRRESANSSIGSMRRLLTVNRGCRHKIPVHVRANVIKNFIFLVIAHGLISTTLLPLISLQVNILCAVPNIHPLNLPSHPFPCQLQASNSIWFEMRQSYSSVITTGAVGTENDNTTDTTADDNIVRGVSMSTPAVDGAESGQSNNILLGPPNEIGSLLLSMTFLLTSGMCFLTALAIKKMGHYLVVFCSYVGVALFLICHLWPTYYTLFPGYLVLGVVFGPLCISKLNLVILMANKLSCGQHECCNAVSTPTVNPSATGVDGTDEHILFAKPSCCSRDENIRRLARWFHSSQNFGIICGSIIISLLLTCAAFQPIVSNRNLMMTSQPQSKGQNKTTAITKGDIEYTPAENFDTNNHGQRICGAASCPVWWMHTSSSAYVKYIQSSENATGSGSLVHRISPRKSSNIRTQGTIVVYLILAIVAIVFTVFIGKFTNKKNMTGSQHQYFRYNSVPGLIDTLFFAGPMAYFIGTEQGYILADFMKVIYSDGWKMGQCILRVHLMAELHWMQLRAKVITNGYEIGAWVAIKVLVHRDCSLMTACPSTGASISRSAAANAQHIIICHYFIIDITVADTICEKDCLITMHVSLLQAFVSCSLGPHMVAGALIGMGIMQLIASSTLSMLLSNTKRIVVISKYELSTSTYQPQLLWPIIVGT